jgi:hypothetical protein
MDLPAQLHVVSAAGWLLLPVALVIPLMTRGRAASESASRSVWLVPVVAAAIAGVAGLVDGIAPIRIVVCASLGAMLGWLGTGTEPEVLPEEPALELSPFIRLAIKYSAVITLIAGGVMILSVWT